MEVCADKPFWIRCAVGGVETVQDVAAEAGNFFVINNLSGARTWLRELACHPRNPNDGFIGTPNQDQTHLKQQLNFGVNRLFGAVGKQFRAVASLEKESFAQCCISKAVLELDNFRRSDDRG